MLLEFHQPQGTAWFDDVTLAQLGRPTENLLAAPGFEADDPAPGKLQAAGEAYEARIQALLRRVRDDAWRDEWGESAGGARKERQALAAWIRSQGLARVWPRELRDLDDAAVKLRLGASSSMAGSADKGVQARRLPP